jgi:O-antigen/teichoic acid export membrane protein
VGPEERPLAPDVFLMLFTKVSLLVLGVLSTVIMARALGVGGRGAVAVAFSFTLLLIQFGSLGLVAANPFFAARDRESIGRIVANSLWISLAIGVVLICAGVVIKLAFPATLRGLDWLEVMVVLVGIPAALAGHLLQSVLLAEGRMKGYNGIELLSGILLVAGLAIGYAVFDMGILGTLVLMVGLNVGSALAYFLLLRVHAPPLSSLDLELARRMLGYGFRIYVSTLIAYLVGRINLLLVNSLLGNSEAGLYSICVALAEGMYLFPSVVAINLFPRVARGGHFEQSAAAFRTVGVLYALFCLVSIPLVGPGIDLLFGDEFSGATQIFYWMLAGIYCYGLINILAYHFAGRGFPLEAMLIWFPGLALNLAIVAIFMPGRGGWVGGLAASVAYAVVLALHMRMFAKESGGYRVLMPRPREVISLVGQLLRETRLRLAGAPGR